MSILNNQWQTDNYKFVGKAFDSQYANYMNELLKVVGKTSTNSRDYELTGTGGYGELRKYDSSNLNVMAQKRGFKTIVTPEEYTGSAQLGMLQTRVDKSGECAKAGKRLGYSTAMTVYLHMLRMFGNAFDAAYVGGDGEPFASASHPVASLGSSGRKYTPDPDSGTYSNLYTLGLSVDSMGKLETGAREMITPDGLPLACNLDTLLVSPALEQTAAKICGPNSKMSLMPKLNPDDSTNAANPVYGKQYLVIGGGKDGFGPKQWAYCDSMIMKEVVKLIYIIEPTLYENALDNPLIQQFTAYTAFGMGWGDSRQIMFSNPA